MLIFLIYDLLFFLEDSLCHSVIELTYSWTSNATFHVQADGKMCPLKVRVLNKYAKESYTYFGQNYLEYFHERGRI